MSFYPSAKGNQVEVQTLFRDQYQRMICKVKLINILDRTLDIDLTWMMISTGNAWYLIEPNQTDEEKVILKGWQGASVAGKRGLWGIKGRKLRPSTWRSRNRRFLMEKEFEELW